MAAPALTYTLTNGQTADASQVMQNFNDLLNGISDGTKDLSISALTTAGTATLNGHVNLGNSSADDLTVTASLASTIPIKTTNSYNIGDATHGLAGAYFGTADTDTARIVSATLAASRTYTLPDAGAAADFVMSAGTQTIAGVKTFSSGIVALVPVGHATGSASDNVYSGTYTPTITDSSNIGSSSAGVWQFSRTGNTVTVSGRLDIDPVTATRWTVFASLPVGGNFAGATQACGYVGGINSTGNNTGTIVGRASNAQIIVDAYANHTTSLDYYVSFTYQVI